MRRKARRETSADLISVRNATNSQEDEDRHPSGSDERHVKLRVHGAVRVIVNWMIL